MQVPQSGVYCRGAEGDRFGFVLSDDNKVITVYPCYSISENIAVWFLFSLVALMNASSGASQWNEA